MDLMTVILTGLLYSFRMTPFIVTGASAVRVLLLLSGQKREFEDWTRNKVLTLVSIVFLPGTLAFMAIRYLIALSFGVDVEDIGSSSAYGEIDVYLKVDRPPRVGVVLVVLFLNVLLAVFISFILIVIPTTVYLQPLIAVACWWIAIGILINCSVRSGDLSLLFASFKRKPQRSLVELLLFVSILSVAYYVQYVGVPA